MHHLCVGCGSLREYKLDVSRVPLGGVEAVVDAWLTVIRWLIREFTRRTRRSRGYPIVCKRGKCIVRFRFRSKRGCRVDRVWISIGFIEKRKKERKIAITNKQYRFVIKYIYRTNIYASRFRICVRIPIDNHRKVNYAPPFCRWLSSTQFDIYIYIID